MPSKALPLSQWEPPEVSRPPGAALVPTHDARLPETYESAKQALAECSRIDECKDWADKSQALASYAKQVGDDTLHKFARRIQLRAMRRMGELIKTFRSNGGRPKKTMDDAVPSFPGSQKEAAEQAGMSERQTKAAVRSSNVPEEDFEAAVESDDPPTMTKLAHMHRPAPPGFIKATNLIGAVRRFSEFCEENPPGSVSSGVLDFEVSDLRARISVIDGWLDQFIVNLGD